jgi:uncharacterized protein
LSWRPQARRLARTAADLATPDVDPGQWGEVSPQHLRPGPPAGRPPIGYAPRGPDLERGDTNAMLKLIEAMAKAMVDQPDQVRVNGVEGENSLVTELRVAKEDIGKVIGKNGRTIIALRTILHASRAQKDKRHVLEVLE